MPSVGIDITPTVAGVQFGKTGTKVATQLVTTNSSNQTYIDFTWIGQDSRGGIIYNSASSNFMFYRGATLEGQWETTAVCAHVHLALSGVSLRGNTEHVTLSDCYQALDSVNAKTLNILTLIVVKVR